MKKFNILTIAFFFLAFTLSCSHHYRQNNSEIKQNAYDRKMASTPPDLCLDLLTTMMQNSNSNFTEIITLKWPATLKKLIGKNTLTDEEKKIATSVLNPSTRTNIGGSLSEMSDDEYIKFLEKISNGKKLSKYELQILKNLDEERAQNIYLDLLTSPKIHPHIRGRTSPRAYDSNEISEKNIKSIFEAARWGASAFNEQPWRYIYATKSEPEKYAKLKSMLDPWNQTWAKDAPVLAIALKKKTFTYNGKPNPFADHDLGMAQANLEFQAQSLGVSVHPMGGFFPDKIKAEFNLPDDYEPMTMMTMGYRGNVKVLPADMHEGELKGRERKALMDMVSEGVFENKKSFKSLPKDWDTETFSLKQVEVNDSVYKIHQTVSQRSSKRAFAEGELSDEEIGSLIEAARWAPSAFNEQPWHFIFVSKRSPDYEKFSKIVNEFNAPWATKSDVLILGLVKKNFSRNGKSNTFGTHDLGIAQGNIQLQAESLGLNSRQMGGIKPEDAKQLLNIPEDYEPISVIAVGKKSNDISTLPENYRSDETAPRTRKTLEEIVNPF